MLEQLNKRTPSSTRAVKSKPSLQLIPSRKIVQDESFSKLLPIASQPKISLVRISGNLHSPAVSAHDVTEDVQSNLMSIRRLSNPKLVALLGKNSKSTLTSNFYDIASRVNSKRPTFQEGSIEDSRHSHLSIRIKDKTMDRFPALTSRDRGIEIRNERVEKVRELQIAIMDLKLQISDLKNRESNALVDSVVSKDNLMLKMKAIRLKEKLEKTNRVISVTNNRVLKAISSIVGKLSGFGSVTESSFKVLSEHQLEMLLERESVALQSSLQAEKRNNDFLTKKLEFLQSKYGSDPWLKPEQQSIAKPSKPNFTNRQHELLEMMRLKNNTVSTKKLKRIVKTGNAPAISDYEITDGRLTCNPRPVKPSDFLSQQG